MTEAGEQFVASAAVASERRKSTVRSLDLWDAAVLSALTAHVVKHIMWYSA
jgi:hypothetical protein